MSGSTQNSPRRRRLRRGAWLTLVVGLVALAMGMAFLNVRRNRELEARAAIAKAREELGRGQPSLALRSIAQVSESGPWEAALLTVKGLAYAALDRTDMVLPALNRSLKLDPDQPVAAKVLAALYFAREEPDRGFAFLEQAARIDQGDFRPWFAAGDILLRFQNQPEEAARAFREALKRDPKHEDSRIGLIDALLTVGDSSEVTTHLETVLGDRPNDPKVLRLASRHARLLGRVEEMNGYNERALAIDPGRPRKSQSSCLLSPVEGPPRRGPRVRGAIDRNLPEQPGGLELARPTRARIRAQGTVGRDIESAPHGEPAGRQDR